MQAADSILRRHGVLCLLALLLGAIAATSSAAAAASDTAYIPLEEIEPGQRGYGLTVFHGTEIDTFGVEVVGVQRGSRVAGDIIIVEVSGHDLEVSSIAQA